MRAAATALLLAALGTAPAAQEIPPEGAFTVNFTSTLFHPIAPVPTGSERQFGVYHSVLTATNAEGRGFLHNLTGRCVGWFSVDLAEGTYAQETRCFYTDADGDQLWEDVTFEPQPLAPVRIAAGRWTGGTGKYEGVRGEFEIRLRPLRAAAEGVVQAIGTKQGSYRIAR